MTAVIATSSVVHHPKHHYKATNPGCETRKCDKRVGRKWWKHHHPHPTVTATQEAVASWYDDAEGTACGTHYSQGVANKTLACGTVVRLCHEGCEEATVQDRGPFIAGREFDLNPGAKEAIGCSDICDVRWAIVR